MSQDDRRGRAGDTRHPMVLRHPKTLHSKSLCHLGHRGGLVEGAPRITAGHNGGEIEDRERGHGLTLSGALEEVRTTGTVRRDA
jgi:hypothetical protein